MQSLEDRNLYQYTCVSNNIEVSVRPFYAAELSSSSSHSHVYIYKIKIKNHSPDDIKLLSREWNIAQEDGFFEIVRGEGVVGKQPVIKSGGEFEYASQAILFAPSGMMYGSFYCLNLHTWKNIEVKIPAFSLDREVVIQ